jgi:hypothetical protein
VDPAAIDARACSYLREQARIAAQKPPPSGRYTKIVGQKADCTGRSVTRVYAVDPLGKRGRRELGAAVQSMSDKLWCSSAYFRLLIGRGWTFSLEFREAGEASVIAATTRQCPG